MYSVLFFKDSTGQSDVVNFLEKLREHASNDKNARIQFNQAVFCIQLLENMGNVLPANIAKHITENIWELRPGNNRIFYFCTYGNAFVLLHHFRKRTQKTPASEIEKAKKERDNYLLQKRSKINGNMG